MTRIMNKIKKIFENRSEILVELKWLLAESRGVYKYALVFFVISLFSMLFSIAAPVASKYVVDAAIDSASEFRFEYALIMLGASLVSIVFGAFSSIFSGYVNEKFAFDLRAKMFDRTQRSAWKNISSFHSGDMLARLTSDVDTVSLSIIGLVPGLAVTAVQLVIILAILLKTDPVIAAIGLVAGPAGMLLGLAFRKPYKKCQTLLRESQSEYYTFFQETLGNPDITKAFQLENANNAYFDGLRARRMKTVMKGARLGALMSSVMRLVYGVGYVVAFCWCASRIGAKPGYTYGTMTLFLSLVGQLQGAVKNLGGVLPQIYSTVISAKRIREISERQPEPETKKTDIPDGVGLKMKNVSFSYEKGDILNNIRADIAPFERVGIVGSSGAGKTTFIRLLLALVEPDAGEVEFTFANGESEKASHESRRFISYVPQGNTLMTGSVRDNLKTGDPHADEKMMWDALEKAGAAEFVRKDPRGLDMPVYERSGGISAGQAQRICIARALLRDRPVLIFDEATSALDEPTERKIFETLSNDAQRTYFIVTHRSSMLRYCTSVIEINDDGSLKYTRG